ncbi:homogentisate 1,2-dioxygenase [Planosporangium mesophilum]|uniref:Homogentisate 1,2-dioxygenase n=1 Tax=Planosporangium mesophilum TaxID=689768 RepID=A0A8J3TIK4_9ACTN|nr:homogentisate 1,2-dioxygenase domain-containing protein [Planosporangium mesophilum]NJC83655.1 homogentisate 1,2-dioxygenase [Planosporangium mesophilum]GII25319.1 homogentisate 1,2-dioxygenase [Planosporangium mesophilum]
MPYYRSVGDLPRKRHTQFRQPDGSLYAEELMGQEGFSSDSSLLYHRHLPTAIVAAEEFTPPARSRRPNLPLKPRHLRTHKLDSGGADPILGRAHLLANDDCRISYAVADRPSPLYRNAIGDECVYVEAGRARIESVFGALEVGEGDYVIIPTSVIHRIVPLDGLLRTLVIEATGHIGPPKRYLSVRGQFLEHAPYCERDLRGPSQPLIVDGTDVDVYVQHRRGWTTFTYANHPFDVVGWDGCLYPWAFSIHDFEPITGRVHQPPPVHQTFEGPNFVICSFVPRKVDYHPLAIPVPYNHHNVDSDEVLFYTGGNYEARRGSGIEQGSISLHPSGFTHGPQPGAAERAIGVDYFDELAVMVDTFRPLDLCEPALACEDSGYAWTWAGRSS